MSLRFSIIHRFSQISGHRSHVLMRPYQEKAISYRFLSFSCFFFFFFLLLPISFQKGPILQAHDISGCDGTSNIMHSIFASNSNNSNGSLHPRLVKILGIGPWSAVKQTPRGCSLEIATNPSFTKGCNILHPLDGSPIPGWATGKCERGECW